jgi:hypothetical protein
MTGLRTPVATIVAIGICRIIHSDNKIEKKGKDSTGKDEGVHEDPISQLTMSESTFAISSHVTGASFLDTCGSP